MINYKINFLKSKDLPVALLGLQLALDHHHHVSDIDITIWVQEYF